VVAKQVKNNVDLKLINEEQPAFVVAIVRFFTRYRDVLGYLLMAILVVGVLSVLMAYNNRVKNTEAAELLQKALKQYQQDVAATTISFQTESPDDQGDATTPEIAIQAKSAGAFQAVYDNYPGTDSGRNALFMVAVSRLNLGVNDEALDAFDIFISKYPDNLLTPSAQLGKSTALFNLGQTSESLDLLNTIESQYPTFNLLDVVAYEKAKRYESLEQWNKAKDAYQSIVDHFPDSTWKSMSDNALQSLEDKLSNESANAV